MSEKITIAQALRRIKKLKGQIAEHDLRAKAGVSYIDSKAPSFKFSDEVAALKEAKKEMLDLEARVAVANGTAFVADGNEQVVLALAIRRLQELKGEIVFLKSLQLRNEVVKERANEWSPEKNQYVVVNIETTYVSDLSEKDRSDQVRVAQDHFETLNNAVEDANHKVLV